MTKLTFNKDNMTVGGLKAAANTLHNIFRDFDKYCGEDWTPVEAQAFVMSVMQSRGYYEV